MSEINKSKIGVVILAAGRGTRLGCVDMPKVMMEIGGKPIVSYIVDTLEKMGFSSKQICLVVGYHKEKVMEYFGERVTYAVQEELLGTAHAAYTGMKVLSENIEEVLVIGGDDSAFYTEKSLLHLLSIHEENNDTLTLLSAEVESPAGLGRVVRQENGDFQVIEKEYLTPEQESIHEISTGTFVFKRSWFENMFPTMPKLQKLGEYGLPTTLTLVREEKLPYHVVRLEDGNEFFGVNTLEQLEEAHKRKNNT